MSTRPKPKPAAKPDPPGPEKAPERDRRNQKNPRSYFLSDVAVERLETLAEHTGLTRVAILEQAIRVYYEREIPAK